ncbi:AB hydrolase-1 domain-containing protein [Mycena sanguinolenta]|uniref:AB hydrolase-1 domain-containing protein n=1 Tax=Mycena sanguinolenta TaxID=230812 RepID=A0A8H6Z6Z4_9AGAR|nr:AB hydrolase-1 domain-containing protein [Mycena sanguinolenta]
MLAIHSALSSSSSYTVFLEPVLPLSLLPPALVEKNAHHIVPTLAGWGYSSPRPSSQNYADTLTSDMTELITHLHPNTADLDIYVSGGSYGTVPAQMLYGAPFDKFPLGRNIRGCLILAPFSPFKWHKEYTKSMTWSNYISVGPPARVFPFQLLQRTIIFALSTKMNTVEKAEEMLRKLLFAGPPEERAAFARWREERGIEGGGVGAPDGDRHGQEHLENLDKDHTSGRPILIAASINDELGPDMANWLEENYTNSRLKWVPGKHLSTLYEVDNLWAELLAMANESASSPAAL